MMDELGAEIIRQGLTTRFIGQQVHYYPEVASTNDIARRLAAEGAPEGALVIADHQTAGRGRLGRSWLAPAGTSLLFSLLFRPPLSPPQAPRVAMTVALGVVDGITQVTGLKPRLKWPNDVLIEGRKVCGLLTETGMTGERLDHVVVGVGLNVNFDPRDVPGIPPTATSLAVALGRPVERVPLLQAILTAIEGHYERLRTGESPHNEWAALLDTLGKLVRVTTPDGVEEGIAENVDADGGLLLRRSDGSRVRILVGDVTRVRPTGESA
jgi:BirA family biotin operon repressor/biotin-[acetyl-CoA-carboxylase] ligase